MQATGKGLRRPGRRRNGKAPEGKAPNGRTRASASAFLLEQLPPGTFDCAAHSREAAAPRFRWKIWCMRACWGLMDALQEIRFEQATCQFSSYAKFPHPRRHTGQPARAWTGARANLRRKARMLEETSLQLSRPFSEERRARAEMAKELGPRAFSLPASAGARSRGLKLAASALNRHVTGREEDLCEYLPDDPEDTPLPPAAWKGKSSSCWARVIGELSGKRTAGGWRCTTSRNSQ